MQDNELDKLINDAASQHHPPYDDEAWGKMLVLLNRHLPEQKDRRRPFIFWMLFLLLGGAVTLGIIQPWNNKNPETAAGNNSAAGKTGSEAAGTALQKESEKTNPQQGLTGNETIPGAQNTITESAIAGKQTGSAVHAPVTAIQNSGVQMGGAAEQGKIRKTSFTVKGKSVIKTRKPVAVSGDEEITASEAVKEEPPATTNMITGKAVIPSYGEAGAASSQTPPVSTNKTPNTDAEKNNGTAKNDSATALQNAVTNTVIKQQKKDKSFVNNFALTLSAGADMSFIELRNPGKVKLFYGAGAAYPVGKHLKLSAGFYVSKKVYNAAPYQYKFPNGATYPNLKEINADCNIYEIPLNIYYNFKQHKNHNWFAGAGLSSLLMKKEMYNYQYKTPAGQSYSYAKTVTNENNHYFSVVTLSGGCQYKLSSRISVMAEPYLKLPLGGVGAGKIKLNSTGVLVTAAVKPFAKSKK